jgi:hypothetical protein
MERKEITPQPDGNIWKIALALVCAGILGYGFLYSKNEISNLSYLIGYNLPLALVVWGIFYAAVARKSGAKIGGFSFIAIYISLIASGLIGYSQQKQEAKQALTDIKNQYSALIESSTDSQGVPKRIEKPIDTTPKASGDIGEMERFSKEFLNQIASQRNDYLLELETIGWKSILDANRIKADKTFVESKDTIQKAKEIVNKYREKTTTLLSNTKEKIHSLNISESSKKGLLSGFEQGIKESKNNTDAVWSLEGKIINEFENIINLLSDKKEAWIVEGKKIIFYDSNDLDRFNSYISSIQKIANQQKEIQNRSIQTFNRNIDSFK